MDGDDDVSYFGKDGDNVLFEGWCNRMHSRHAQVSVAVEA